MTALRARHQVKGPEIDKAVIPRMWRALTRLRPRAVDCVSEATVIARYSGGKRSRYEMAFASLRTEALSKKDAVVSMFVKDDKYVEWGKAPRCIQYRSARYTGVLARYLIPVEHRVYSTKVDGYRVFAKGRNQEERAADLIALWESFDNPYIINVDHSKWDSKVSLPLLRLERKFYSKFNGSRKLRQMLKWQERNRGFTRGVKYFTPGTRMSGDFNTGLGNSILNYAILQSAFPDARIYCDGDDAVVFSRTRPEMPDWTRYGMETVTSVGRGLEFIDFCQSRICLLPTGARMLRDPGRMIPRAGWTCRNAHPRFLERVCRSVGMCEVALNRGAPIGQALGLCMQEAGRGRFVTAVDPYYTARLEKSWDPIPVTDEAREAYAVAFGITPTEQIAVEKAMQGRRCWDTDDLVGRAHGLDGATTA